MVLESIFSAKKIESKPIDMFILSVIVSVSCILISNSIFTQYAGIIAPLLVTVAMTPVVYRIFRIEEETERSYAEHKITAGFIERHGETIYLFCLFFLGNFLTVFLISVIAPEKFVTELFAQQIEAITAINTAALSMQAIVGYVTASKLVEIILINNLKVMLFAFILSFLIGTGALFILSWNASILGVYLASFIKKGLFSEFISRTAGIAPHAPLELGGYFLAGIAGGILSVGMIRENIKSREFRLVFKDSLILMAFAIIAVGIGALAEVYI